MSLRHRLFSTGFQIIAASGADRLLAPATRGRGVILTFHHVRPWRPRAFAPNRLLEITPDFLETVLDALDQAGFVPVPLDDVPDRLSRPGPPFAALTFDDGYRDNLVHAAPILARRGVPWTLFVTRDYAEGTGSLWWLELEEGIKRRERVEVVIDGEPLALPARTPAEKAAAFERLYWTLRSGPEERLRAVTGALAREAGVDPGALVRELCLGWEELSALARQPNVLIGAHTLSHPMLAKHPVDVARREIIESRKVIEERLGVGVRHLSYPVGDPTSAGPREFAIAREAGFAIAVTTRPGHVFTEHAAHLHALPRVSVNGLFQTESAIRALLSGVPFLAWNRGRRVDPGIAAGVSGAGA